MISSLVIKSDAIEFMKKYENNSVDCVITDPPYPIDRDNVSGRLFSGHEQEKQWFSNSYENWDLFWAECSKEMVRLMKNGSHFYVFTNETNLWNIKEATEKENPSLKFKSLLVWHKGSKEGEAFGMGYHYRKSCEYVLLWSKAKSTRFIMNQGVILPFPRNDYYEEHPTPKPVPLIKKLIENSTDKGGVILDPFCGSGSAARAASQSERIYLCCDIDQKWVDYTITHLNQKEVTKWFA